MYYDDEEEIEKMLGKIEMLKLCCKIKDLGFTYRENDIVAIDIYANEGGWNGPCEIDIIYSIIKPTLGDGRCEINDKIREELETYDIELPMDLYYDDFVSGVTYTINNFMTKELYESGRYLKKDWINFINSFYWGFCEEESSVDIVQVAFSHNGMHLIFPTTYIYPQDFIESYILFYTELIKIYNQYEEDKEAA